MPVLLSTTTPCLPLSIPASRNFSTVSSMMPLDSPAALIQNEDFASVNARDIASILQRCTSVSECRRIHGIIKKCNLQCDAYLGNLLIGACRKCGSLEDARSVFDSMESRTVVSWNSIIAAYVQRGHGEEARGIYDDMKDQCIVPNRFTFISSIAACSILWDLEEGKSIHSRVVEIGLDADTQINTVLLELYVKCGTIQEARSVFDRMQQHDVVSWTSMIAAYVQQGDGREACKLFWKMQSQNVIPDEVSFSIVLGACDSPESLLEGRAMHACIIENGYKADGILGTALLNMYQKSGALDDAVSVFHAMEQKDVVCWTTMIMALVDHGLQEEALQIYDVMEHQGFVPNEVTFVTLLGSYATPDSLPIGKTLHAKIMDSKFGSDVMVKTAIINMYGKCGACELAREIFDKEDGCDLVLWNAMLTVYVQQGQSKMASDLFNEMKNRGMEPDQVTFSTVLGACAGPADIVKGKAIHAMILETSLASDTVLGNSLVNMYSKCGSMADASIAFERLLKRDLISWNVIISSYCQHGHGNEVLYVFEKMQENGVKPDGITFLCLLSACSHAGLLEEGHRFFWSMSKEHNVVPDLGHYCCMIDLLGRAGHLEDAGNLMKEMPFEPDYIMYMTYLNACKMHGDVRRAEHISKQIFDMDTANSESYILLSNIYVTHGSHHEAGS